MEDGRGFRPGRIRGKKGQRAKKGALRAPVPPPPRPASALAGCDVGDGIEVSGRGYDVARPASAAGRRSLFGGAVPGALQGMTTLQELLSGSGARAAPSRCSTRQGVHTPYGIPSAPVSPTFSQLDNGAGSPRGGTPAQRPHSPRRADGRRDDLTAVQLLICDRITDSEFVHYINAAEPAARNAALRELLYQFRRAKGFVTVAQQLPLPELYSVMVANTVQQLGCENAVIHIYDAENDLVYHPLSPAVRVSSGVGVAARLVRERKKLQVGFHPDEEMLPEDVALFGAACKDALVVPLMAKVHEGGGRRGAPHDPLQPPTRPQVIGMMSAMNKKAGKFTPQDHRMFEALAQQCAAGLTGHLTQARLAAATAQLRGYIDVACCYREDLAVKDIECAARKLLGAERSRLYLVDAVKRQSLTCVLADGHKLSIPLSGGVAGTVHETGRLLNIPAAYHDERFNTEVDRLTGFVTTSLLAVPVVHPANLGPQRLGIFEVLNKHDGSAFTDLDEKAATAFAAQIAYILCTNEGRAAVERDLVKVQRRFDDQKMVCLVLDRQLVCREMVGDVEMIGVPDAVMTSKPMPLWYLSAESFEEAGAGVTYVRRTRTLGRGANAEFVTFVKEVLRTGTPATMPVYQLQRPRQPSVCVSLTARREESPCGKKPTVHVQASPIDTAVGWIRELSSRASSTTTMAVVEKIARATECDEGGDVDTETTATANPSPPPPPERMRATILVVNLCHTGGVMDIARSELTAPLQKVESERKRRRRKRQLKAGDPDVDGQDDAASARGLLDMLLAEDGASSVGQTVSPVSSPAGSPKSQVPRTGGGGGNEVPVDITVDAPESPLSAGGESTGGFGGAESPRGSNFSSARADDPAPLAEEDFQAHVFANLDAHVSSIAATVKASGGIILSWCVDRLVAAFGPPREATDDVEAAVRVALLIRTAHPDTHVAVHSGDVAVGLIHGAYTCLGAHVDVAIQLAEVAAYYHAGVVVTERSLQQAEGAFFARGLEELYFNNDAVSYMTAHEVLCLKCEQNHRFERMKVQLQAAHETFKTRDWARTCTLLRELYDEHQDMVAAALLRRALQIRTNHLFVPSIKWSGVFNACTFQPHIPAHAVAKPEREATHRSSFRPKVGLGTDLLPTSALPGPQGGRQMRNHTQVSLSRGH